VDRTKLSEDEAFEHAIDMISSRQMGFRKAADFFQVRQLAPFSTKYIQPIKKLSKKKAGIGSKWFIERVFPSLS
jgi:hypothetical protein